MSLELEALGELVLNLELGAEKIGGTPSVREDGSILHVVVFALELAHNGSRL